MQYTWKITQSHVDEYEKSRKAWSKQWRKAQMYCNLMVDCEDLLRGFNKNEDDMYEQELKDLETAYNKTLDSINNKMDDLVPDLVEEMKMFVQLYETKETIEGKLSTLKEKMGAEYGNEA